MIERLLFSLLFCFVYLLTRTSQRKDEHGTSGEVHFSRWCQSGYGCFPTPRPKIAAFIAWSFTQPIDIRVQPGWPGGLPAGPCHQHAQGRTRVGNAFLLSCNPCLEYTSECVRTLESVSFLHYVPSHSMADEGLLLFFLNACFCPVAPVRLGAAFITFQIGFSLWSFIHFFGVYDLPSDLSTYF